MTVSVDLPTAFPLYLRVPGWCRRMEVSVAGQTELVEDQPGKLARINRTWADGDSVKIRFGVEIAATEWPRNGAITVDRGPLSYSIRIKEEWQKQTGEAVPDNWPRWSAVPGSPWNYGLAVDPKNPTGDITARRIEPVADQPWSETAAPVVSFQRSRPNRHSRICHEFCLPQCAPIPPAS